jgi:hypothetical protein
VVELVVSGFLEGVSAVLGTLFVVAVGSPSDTLAAEDVVPPVVPGSLG